MDKETKKQPEVELDLDDAKETLVELKEKEEPKKAPNLKQKYNVLIFCRTKKKKLLLKK